MEEKQIQKAMKYVSEWHGVAENEGCSDIEEYLFVYNTFMSLREQFKLKDKIIEKMAGDLLLEFPKYETIEKIIEENKQQVLKELEKENEINNV